MQRVLGALQMVSESDPDRCVSEDAKLSKEVDVTSHIGWEGERSLPYKGVDTFSCMTRFGRCCVAMRVAATA